MSQPDDLAAEIVRRAEEVSGLEHLQLTPDQVEAVLRPFADRVEFETREQVRRLVTSNNALRYCLDHWIEAHIVVTGRGPAERIEFMRNFLLRGRCECVLVHLPTAIARHNGPVDDRVRRALEMGSGVG